MSTTVSQPTLNGTADELWYALLLPVFFGQVRVRTGQRPF